MKTQPGLVGDNLKRAREMRALTQEEFAALMEIDQQQVSRWETGTVHPKDSVIYKMATILKVSSDFLLGLVNDPMDYLGDMPLTPVQRRLLWALDEGHITIALETFTELSKTKD